MNDNDITFKKGDPVLIDDRHPGTYWARHSYRLGNHIIGVDRIGMPDDPEFVTVPARRLSDPGPSKTAAAAADEAERIRSVRGY